jgi:hypothetical protein
MKKSVSIEFYQSGNSSICFLCLSLAKIDLRKIGMHAGFDEELSISPSKKLKFTPVSPSLPEEELVELKKDFETGDVIYVRKADGTNYRFVLK